MFTFLMFIVTLIVLLIFVVFPVVLIPVTMLQLLFSKVLATVIILLLLLIIFYRLNVTGAIHLVEFSNWRTVLLLYFHRGGTITIVPTIKTHQGFLKTPSGRYLKDTGIPATRLAGHACRIAIETVHHTVDPSKAEFASRMKEKYGFNSLSQLHNFALKYQEEKYGTSMEMVEDLEEEEKKQHLEDE